MKWFLNIWDSELNTLTAAVPRVNSAELNVNRAGVGNNLGRLLSHSCYRQRASVDKTVWADVFGTMSEPDTWKMWRTETQRGLLLMQHFHPHIYTSPSVKGKLGCICAIYTVFFMVLGKHILDKMPEQMQVEKSSLSRAGSGWADIWCVMHGLQDRLGFICTLSNAGWFILGRKKNANCKNH